MPESLEKEVESIQAFYDGLPDNFFGEEASLFFSLPSEEEQRRLGVRVDGTPTVLLSVEFAQGGGQVSTYASIRTHFHETYPELDICIRQPPYLQQDATNDYEP